MAALDAALREALVDLDPQEQIELKRAFGDVMGEVVETLINPAIRAFPELDPSDDTWRAVAIARGAARAIEA